MAFLERCEENAAIRTVAQSLSHKLTRKLQEQLESEEEVVPGRVRRPSFSALVREAPLLEQSSEEIARQLTLIEWEIWVRIQPWECLGLSWTKKDKSLAPNVLELINRFNLVSGWVATTVCTQESLKRRVKHVQKFIEIGYCLCGMGNYNAVMEVVSGLNRGPVYRLRQTWDGVATPLRKNYEQLSQIVDRSKSYANMRRCLKSVNPPCIPYLGMYLTDLMFIEEGNRDYLNGLINWNKRHQISETIRAIKQYQQQPYRFQSVPPLREMLMSIHTLSEDELYQISEWLEPRPGRERGPRPAALGEKVKKHHASSTLGAGQVGAGQVGQAAGMVMERKESVDFELEFDRDYVFATPDSPSNLDLDPTTNSVRAATLPKLIERLTHHANPDSNSLFSFLATFQSFATPAEVLELLIARFNVPPSREKAPAAIERYRQEYETPVMLRVFNLLKTWIDRHFYHFQEDPELFKRLVGFVQGPLSEKQPRLGETLKLAIQRHLARGGEADADLERPTPVVPEQVCSVFDLDSREVARQLCLMHHAPFAAIKSQELLDASRSLATRADEAPNVRALQSAYNSLRQWVTAELVSAEQRDSSSTASAVVKWIDIAETCSESRNLLATRAVLHALHSYRQRSPSHFERLPVSSTAYFERECRDVLHQYSVKIQLSPPCVPVIQDYLAMLRDSQEQHAPDMIGDKINFEKCRVLGEILQLISRLQRFKYPFLDVPIIQNYIGKFSASDASDSPSAFLSLWSTSFAAADDRPHHGPPPPREDPSSPSNSISSQYLFRMIDSLNSQLTKQQVHLMALELVSPHQPLIKQRLRAFLTGACADLDLDFQPPSPKLECFKGPSPSPFYDPAPLLLGGQRLHPELHYSNLPTLNRLVLSSSPLDSSRALGADSPDFQLQQAAANFLSSEFPDAQRVCLEFAHPKTGKPLAVQIVEKGNRKFLCDVRPYVDLDDVANLLLFGKQYKRDHPDDLLACIVLTRSISPIALEKTNQYKIKVHII
ncbi:son of sevenless homolog [Schistocerca gregaria]|uniref:son of sevenless homolog n=1 Tax=Schistocerca gregaria TaxID=7010 RepID=UPI00211E6371|nr:son of sevenless homolog [Schistocerca gregaria]